MKETKGKPKKNQPGKTNASQPSVKIGPLDRIGQPKK